MTDPTPGPDFISIEADPDALAAETGDETRPDMLGDYSDDAADDTHEED